VCVCVCVCEREKERESVYVCVFEAYTLVNESLQALRLYGVVRMIDGYCMCVCVYLSMRVRVRGKFHPLKKRVHLFMQ
jgi:hypothetical protein